MHCADRNCKKFFLTVGGLWAANSYIIKMHILCAHFLDKRTIKIDNFYLAKLLEFHVRPVAPPPPFLHPCYRIREIINGIKVLSYWKGDIERSQIFRPASDVAPDNSTEIFINSDIIVFTPVIFLKKFCVCLKRVESKQLSIQHQVILFIVKIGNDFISIHELTEPTLKKISFRLIFLPKLFQKSTVLHLCCQNISRGGRIAIPILAQVLYQPFKSFIQKFSIPKSHYPKEEILNFWIACINSAGIAHG